MTNSSLHRHGKKKFYAAVKENGETFRDKSFHKFLTNKGYKREDNDQGNPSEWFYDITDETIEKELFLFTKKKVRCLIVLRPHQQDVYEQVLKADKKYNLLSLAPRFGKTYTILEIAQYYFDQSVPVVLVPASKSLSSNASFINDYSDGGYTFPIINNASLFMENDKIIENLRDQIGTGKKIILVTDEADVASHTDISVEKLKEIEENFDVFKIFVMSGTAIYKASKIFLDVPEEDIFSINITYTDLFSYINQTELVKRNFVNIRYHSNLMPDGLNIKQSFEQASATDTMVKYVNTFVNDEARDAYFSLGESKVSMVFVPGLQIKYMKDFVKKYSAAYPDVKAEIINGTETTNRKAEEKVKKIINTMKMEKDTRKLVLFSSGMAQRSFSVPLLRRTIILSDGLITPSFLQMSARCLTYDRDLKGEQTGDIIRISTEVTDLAAELFMQERPETNHTSKEAYTYSKRFLMNNTFSEYTFTESGTDGIKRTDITEDNINGLVLEMLDKATKIQDTINYLVARFWDTELEFGDVKAKKVKTESKKNVKDTASNKPGRKNNKKEKNLSKDEEKLLVEYMSIVRCLPYIMGAMTGTKIETLDDLLACDWKIFSEETSFEKKYFSNNLKHTDFKTHIESLFRAKETYTEEEIEERNLEIFTIIGA